MNTPADTRPTNVRLLDASGRILSLADDLSDAMRECQAALLAGDVRAAHRAFDTGRRLAGRIAPVAASALPADAATD